MVAANKIGYPILIELPLLLVGWVRAGNDAELKDMALKAFRRTLRFLIDQDLRGWKELEEFWLSATQVQLRHCLLYGEL
jgi:hypothetical protein